MKGRRGRLLLVVAAFLATGAWGQQFKFRQFTFEDGLPNPFIYNISQTNSGHLMVCTGEGISEYDGIRMYKVSMPKLISNSIVNVARQVNTNTWLGHNDGTISILSRHKIIKTFADSLFNSKIESIEYHQKTGTIWVLSQSAGIKVYDEVNKKLKFAQKLSEDRIQKDIHFVDDNKVVVSSDEGLFLYAVERSGLREIKKVLDEEIVQVLDFNDHFLLLGNSSVWAYYPGENRTIELENDLPEADINSGLVDYLGNLWLATNSGLMKCEITSQPEALEVLIHFNQENGLSTDYIKTIYQDSEHNMWIGSYGGGLALLVDDYFSFYADASFENNNVRSLALEDTANWMVIDNVIVLKDRHFNTLRTYGRKSGLPDDNIQTISLDAANTLWVGFEDLGLYAKKTYSDQFRKIQLPEDRLSNSIFHIIEFNDGVAVGTGNGVFVLDNEGKIINHYSTKNGTRHNLSYDLNLDDEDNIWIGSKSNYVSYISDGNVEELEIPIGGLLLDIIAIYNKDTNVWLGTINNGLIQYSNGAFTHYSTDDGMLSKYCAAIVEDDSGRVWVGHRNGVSRINLRTGKVEVFDAKYGITGEINRQGIHLDKNGKVWLATTTGLVVYDPKKESDQLFPPALELYRLVIDDRIYSSFDALTLGYGDHKLEFGFKGISFKHADELVYKYRLIGFDDAWLTLRSNDPTVTYNKLPPGTYSLQVQTCLGEGNCSEIKTFSSITIDSPYWTKWWFILTCVVAGIVIVLLVIFLRVRQLKKIQNYLQYNLDIKTKEVVDKNKLLERKNKDITDSIRYAKRIQGSLLPEETLLHERFSGSFIFYRPRDIVSGDFYWFEQFGDYVYVVCADCTGHGVPGSLMSMIGSVTIGNILTKRPDLDPAELLTVLDEQIKNILKTKVDDPYGKVQDGMDLAVCKINTKTYKTIVASAKRHFFINRSGKIELFKPSRHSIGGRETDKVFDDVYLDLEKGDIIYLFSDGYTDQIGGPRGRKMMIPGLLTFLESVKNEPLSVQKAAVESHFEKWLGKEYQLDDVLFMAVSV